jgi:hypothetical protein
MNKSFKMQSLTEMKGAQDLGRRDLPPELTGVSMSHPNVGGKLEHHRKDDHIQKPGYQD